MTDGCWWNAVLKKLVALMEYRNNESKLKGNRVSPLPHYYARVISRDREEQKGGART